uniref:A kinase (PRKA) anchor protein 12b n=1 Tax=Cyprinus carpio TaxID=7962 RepID=A0A8C1KTI2_CYPCA
MGATPSVQRDAKSPEDAPEDISAELSDTQDGENGDGKPLQKNGQISISSLNGKTDVQTEYNGHTEENPPAEVGQTDTITQKEDSPETTEVHQEEVALQVNGDKGDNSANVDEITATEEKAEEEKQEEVNEVGFKKIFRFVGFKFTLKKDKNEKTEPVQLLTVKEAESGADATSEEKKEEPATEEDKSVEDKSPETTEKDKKATTEEVIDKAEEPADQTLVDVPSETEKASEEVTEKSAEEMESISEKEPESEVPTESPTSPLSQETQSPFKRFFTQGIFSNLRKKASFKKPKDEEQVKEKSAEEDIQETEETAEGAIEGSEEAKQKRTDYSAQAVETNGEPVTSDSEKKKDGILPWSSFKKLVTPKKRVKRPSESEDEAPGDKPKSSTLSSTESAIFDEKTDEPKPSEEVPSESKEESQTESKAEPKVEKPEPVAEEPKRKMDTSVSWEALICVGSSKKRARKSSDSDDEEPKIEEEVQQSGEEQTKATESPLVSSGEADHENSASSPEPEEELVSTWESFKRLVTHRKKPKAEDKSDDASGPEHTTSDSEAPKEESSFSLRKLIPRRKKKSDGKQEQISSDIGSAEDDSDTPAVVPLSEYENEPTAEVAVKAEEVKQESAPVTQAKASDEDRSPSWISTTVENVEDDTEGKQLSDIPEEGDTAATPKSTDNTIAEDIVELTSEAVTALEQVEDTEMISAVSRVTTSPVTSGETTPVPGDCVEKKTDVVLQEAVETFSVTTNAMAVTMTKEQENIVAVTTDALLVESAIKDEKTVLVAHEKTEAIAVCTGLVTSEIKAVEEESLTQKPSVESITVVSQVLVTELAVEDKTQEPEKSSVTEDEVHEAQMSGGQTELTENAIDEKTQFEEIKETPEPESVTDLQEVAAVKVALINSVQQEPEFLEEPVVAEKSPQVEAAGPVEPTVEDSICAQTVEVTEVAVAEGEKVQELEDVKEVKVTVEVASVEGVAMAVTEEVMANLPEVPASQTAGSTEDPISVIAATEEFAVMKETVCVISSASEMPESHSADLAHETVMEKVPLVLPTPDHKIQVIANDAEVDSAQEIVEGNLEVTSTKVSIVVEEVTENVKEETEVIQATQVTEEEIIEKQGSVIVQEVIQNVVENLAEAHAEQKVPEKTSEEENPSTDKPKASNDICKDDDEQTHMVTEKPVKTVNDTILITETVTVSITDEIQPQNEEVATVSVEDVHQEIEVTKGEVELKKAEEKKFSGTTEREEGKSQAESHPKEVPKEIQQETQASEVSEAIKEEKMTETSVTGASQDQIVAEQCQMAQEVQIETAQEFKVGVINVINADDEPVQDPGTNMKEESSEGQESVEDKPQKDLEEPQSEVSAQDTTNQGESRDPDCQKTDAENVPAKLETATEKTENAITVEEGMEEVRNEIEPVSTEVVTVS